MNIFASIYQHLQFQTDVYTFNFHHLSQINLIGSVWQGKIGSFFIIKCCEENWVQWGNFKKNNHFKADTVSRRDDNDSHYLTAGVGPSHQRPKSSTPRKRHTVDPGRRNNCQATHPTTSAHLDTTRIRCSWGPDTAAKRLQCSLLFSKKEKNRKKKPVRYIL